VTRDSNPNIRINPDLDPDVCRVAANTRRDRSRVVGFRGPAYALSWATELYPTTSSHYVTGNFQFLNETVFFKVLNARVEKLGPPGPGEPY